MTRPKCGCLKQCNKVENKKKKKRLFPEMRMSRKSSPAGPQIYFFNRFSEDIIFSSLVSFAFLCILVLLFWLFFLFFEILIHIWLCGRVSYKFFFTRPVSWSKITFFRLILLKSIVSKFSQQLIKNWMNHESKSFRYEGLLLSVKHWKIPKFVVRGCLRAI